LSISGYSIQTELQADCMSGMFLANTENVLPDVPPDDDALAAALTTFFGIGNKKYSATHWFGDREHGSSQQRIRAYGTGYAASFLTPGLPPPVGYGLAACYGYRDFAVSDFASVGGYRLINLPGRTKQQVDGALVIEPEAGLGFETSGVLLDWLPGATTDDIIALRDTRYPGLRQALPDLKPIDLAGNVKPGSGSATYAEQRAPGIAGGVRSGMISFVEPQAGGGALLVFVYRQAPALSDDAGNDGLRVLAEQVSVTYEVLARLCGPDDSAVVGATNFKPVCTDDQ
jgi:hypothetical protein